MRNKNSVVAFRHALDGLLHAFRTQRHLRFHFALSFLVLLLGTVLRFSRGELALLLFAIALVLVAELFNTCIETVVDMVTSAYHPLAKHAKDVAAAGVLIAAINAVAVGLLLITDRVRVEQWLIGRRPPDQLQLIILGLLLLLLLLVIIKVLGRRGTFLQGGIVSGHTAIGFALATVIILMSQNVVVMVLAALLAGIVAQSRVEAGIHSSREVTLGALLGITLPTLLLWLLPDIMDRFALLPRVGP